MTELLIRSGRMIDPISGREETGDLLISRGKISKAGGRIECPAAAGVLDAEGLIVAPGLVDMHVHLRDPGGTEKEDIFSGCRAAAAGGVTSLLCMPNTQPPLDNPESVSYVLQKARSADARVYVAAAVTEGLKSVRAADWQELRKAGAVALSDDGRPVTSPVLMASALRAAPDLGLTVCAHCEEPSLSAGGKCNEGAVSRTLGVRGIPAAAENCGTAWVIALSESYHVPVHICHVSTEASVSMIRDAKHRGVPVTSETAPHYFALTERELLRRDADFRMSPPLRTERDRQAVIEGLRDGTIDAIATDHAPHTPREKADFLSAPNGVIGMETSLSAGITYLVRPGILTMGHLLRLMSSSPARILRIPAGTLCPGVPADLVLFDPREHWTVDTAKLHGKSRNSVFKGRELVGKVKYTICRGKIVYRD